MYFNFRSQFLRSVEIHFFKRNTSLLNLVGFRKFSLAEITLGSNPRYMLQPVPHVPSSIHGHQPVPLPVPIRARPFEDVLAQVRYEKEASSIALVRSRAAQAERNARDYEERSRQLAEIHARNMESLARQHQEQMDRAERIRNNAPPIVGTRARTDYTPSVASFLRRHNIGSTTRETSGGVNRWASRGESKWPDLDEAGGQASGHYC